MIRIRELRLAAQKSQQDIAKALGVSQAALSGWENGKYSIDNINLLNISNYFGVTTDYILGLSNITPLPEALRPGRNINVFGRVPAGTPIEAVESIVDTVELSEKMSNDGHEYFALLVTGDSMYPEYRDGDIVIARKQAIADMNDDVIAYVNGCDATLKRIAISDKGITLRAINPPHESLSYSNEDVEKLPIVILGVVKELRRSR